MKRKLILKAISLAMALVAGITCSSSASAFSLRSHRLNTDKVYYYFDSGIDSKAISTFNTACENWRNKNSLFVMEKLGSETNVVTARVGTIKSSTVGWDGITAIFTDENKHLTKAIINFNTYYTDSWNVEGARLSVMTHEIGHVFGLDDLEGERAIMNGSTYGPNSRYGTYGLTVPQDDDIRGVSYLFNSGYHSVPGQGEILSVDDDI